MIGTLAQVLSFMINLLINRDKTDSDFSLKVHDIAEKVSAAPHFRFPSC